MSSRPRARAAPVLVSLVAALGLLAVQGSAVAATVSVSRPVNVTHDLYADNEESLGMNGSGTLLAGAWNDCLLTG